MEEDGRKEERERKETRAVGTATKRRWVAQGVASGGGAGGGGGQVMPRLAAQLAWRVGTGQLNALVLAEAPQNEAAPPPARHCVVVSQHWVGLIRLSSVGSVPEI